MCEPFKKNTTKINLNNITIKLGGQCNLNCKYCHSKKIDYMYNPDIIQWIKKTGCKHITFSGGEPTIYFDLIKKIVLALGLGFEYTIVTNATLINDKMISFFNNYKIAVVVSYDGESSKRDFSYIPDYRKVGRIKNRGLNHVFYGQSESLFDLQKEITWFRKKYWDENSSASFYPNFVHQTEKTPNEQMPVKKYVQQFGQLLELDFLRLRITNDVAPLCILKDAFYKWIQKKDYKGVACFNEKTISISIAGDFLVCPYNQETKIGDIYHEINWDTIEEKYLPERCSDCEIKNICKCTCVENKTLNECYIAKVLNKHMRKLMKKYNYSYEELNEIIMNSPIK